MDTAYGGVNDRHLRYPHSIYIVAFGPRSHYDLDRLYVAVGEITEQGFTRKMARLENTLVPAKPATTRASPGPSAVKESAKDISSELGSVNERVRGKIQDLYGRKKAKPPTNPKESKTIKGAKFHRKEVTVFCVDLKTFAVPTRKQRDCLVKEGKVQETFLGKSESESEVMEIMEKLNLLFPDYVLTFLKVIGSKGLIPADMSGCSVMDIVDRINLYVRGEKKPRDPPKEPVKFTPTTSTCMSEVTRSQEILPKNLRSLHLQLLLRL